MPTRFFDAPDKEQMSKLPFLGKEIPYYFTNTSKKLFGGTVFTTTLESFEKAADLLSGKEGYIIKPGDKVFVLYKNSIPRFKIEDHIKQIGARLVSDYTKATVILGSINCVNRNVQLHSASSLAFMESPMYKTIRRSDEKEPNLPEYEEEESLKQYSGNKHMGAMLTTEARVEFLKPTGNVEMDYFEDYENTGYITPLGASMLYYILKNKIPIVSEKGFSSQLAPGTEIDIDFYENIRAMLSSRNQTDINMGCEILANCDIEKSYFYLFKLSKYFWNSVRNNSTIKNIRMFRENAKWDELYRMPEDEFAGMMHAQGRLTRPQMLELMHMSAERFKIKSDLFDIVLVPKQKFENIVTKEDSINFKLDGELTDYDYEDEDEDEY